MSFLGSDGNFEKQLKDDFLTEAAELLSETESLFLQLENDPSNMTLIDKIFRVVHTIKGSGGVAGFKKLTAFSHLYETMLGKLRTKEISPSQDVVDVLLAGVDTLNQFIACLRKDYEASIDTSGIVGRIEAYIEKKQPASAPLMTEKPEEPVKADARATVGGFHEFGDDKPPATGFHEFGDDKPPATGFHEFGDENPVVQAPTSRRRILIVDDEPAMVSVIKEILKTQGYELLSVLNPTEGLALLEANRDIDLLISDQRMPGMTGTEFVEQLRQRHIKIPVIIVSGATEREDALEFIRLGVFDFFEKPIREEKFTLAVANALRLKELSETMEALSKLSIRSYMTFRKILEIVESENMRASGHPAIQKYSTFLEEIGALINRAVSANKPLV